MEQINLSLFSQDELEGINKSYEILKICRLRFFLQIPVLMILYLVARVASQCECDDYGNCRCEAPRCVEYEGITVS